MQENSKRNAKWKQVHLTHKTAGHNRASSRSQFTSCVLYTVNFTRIILIPVTFIPRHTHPHHTHPRAHYPSSTHQIPTTTTSGNAIVTLSLSIRTRHLLPAEFGRSRHVAPLKVESKVKCRQLSQTLWFGPISSGSPMIGLLSVTWMSPECHRYFIGILPESHQSVTGVSFRPTSRRFYTLSSPKYSFCYDCKLKWNFNKKKRLILSEKSMFQVCLDWLSLTEFCSFQKKEVTLKVR